MSKMMEIAARYANGEEEDRIRSSKHKSAADGDGNNNRKQKQKAQSTPQAEEAAITNAKFKGKGKVQYTPKKRQSGNSILDQPIREGQPREKDTEQDDEDKEDPFPQVHATLMIFADVESKSRLKLVNRETRISTLWSQALVIDLVVEGVRLRKVLMDGGSGLNIMYADTLKGMGIPMSKLSKSSMQFHGVVPGRKAKSLGQIELDVVFGSDKNFRKEKLTFEVVDFQSAYHVILGRPKICALHGPAHVTSI
ncbi:hypothetical protein ZWY2020_014666 [Hordeum vulgare]|nr:hypothetical protein ZWY2020_014666 [Hordeum vulgare]